MTLDTGNTPKDDTPHTFSHEHVYVCQDCGEIGTGLPTAPQDSGEPYYCKYYKRMSHRNGNLCGECGEVIHEPQAPESGDGVEEIKGQIKVYGRRRLRGDFNEAEKMLERTVAAIELLLTKARIDELTIGNDNGYTVPTQEYYDRLSELHHRSEGTQSEESKLGVL